MLTASRDASRSLPKFLGVCLIVTGWLIFGMSSTASAAEQLSGINLPEIGHCGHCMPPITEADWNLIHASGFKIIRLPIDPDYIFSDGTVSDDAYEVLKGVLKKSNELGIMLDIDIHASLAFRSRLFRDADFRNRFTHAWSVLARKISAEKDHGHVALEFLNEPGASSAGWWNYQGDLIKTVRAAGYKGKIVASGGGNSAISDLIKNKPYDDGEVLYNFHFYEPMAFTHQGASWVGQTTYANLRGVPWPLSKKKLLDLPGGFRFIGPMLSKSINEWDGEQLDKMITHAASWAKLYGVPLMCNEFGVYRDGGAAETDRAKYLADVVHILNEHRIAWAVWQYQGGFGILEMEANSNAPKIEDSLSGVFH